MNSNQKMMAVMAVISVMLMVLVSCVPTSSATGTTTSLYVNLGEDGAGSTVTANCTVISGTEGTVTATANSAGTAVLQIPSQVGKLWNISTTCSVAGTIFPVRTFTMGSAAAYGIDIDSQEKWKFVLDYDATAFVAGTAGALSYSDPNLEPVAASAFDQGSWSITNPFVASTYYAVFSPTTGAELGRLNPADLTLYTDGTSAASDIASNNVMWCVPTLYFGATDEGSLVMSNDYTEGVASAHTTVTSNGTYIYEIAAYGVYEGTISNSKLLSISGSTPTGSQTREAFRTAAAANVVSNGYARLTNWYDFNLIRYVTFFGIESFDSQAFAQGNVNTSSASVTGFANSSGMYAGSVSDQNLTEKFFIENFWGSLNEFIDDVVIANSKIYAGQNPGGQINDAVASKVDLITVSGNGYPSAISTSSATWGYGTAFSGSNSNGLYDYWYTQNTASEPRLLLSGGSYGDAAYAGVSYVYTSSSLSASFSRIGARLAYVFDTAAGAAAEVTSFTVSFDLYSGPEIPSQSVIGTITVPATPVYEGFTFGGWYDNPQFSGAALDLSTYVVTEDVILYAKWNLIDNSVETHSVSFSLDGGTGISSEIVIDGNVAIEPKYPTKEGFTFGGWYSSSALTTLFDFTSSVTADVNLYAKWIENVYFTVTFDTGSGSAIVDQSVISGGRVIAPTMPTLDGHIFAGWFTDDSCSTEFSFASAINADLTLYAGWYSTSSDSSSDSMVIVVPSETVDEDMLFEIDIITLGIVIFAGIFAGMVIKRLMK